VASQIARLRAVGEGMEARTSPERKRELHRRIERLKRGVAA
jgi:hypothetical protein